LSITFVKYIISFGSIIINPYDDVYRIIEKIIANKEITSFEIEQGTVISHGTTRELRNGSMQIEV
jgi:hypothetical protein